MGPICAVVLQDWVWRGLRSCGHYCSPPPSLMMQDTAEYPYLRDMCTSGGMTGQEKFFLPLLFVASAHYV